MIVKKLDKAKISALSSFFGRNIKFKYQNCKM